MSSARDRVLQRKKAEFLAAYVTVGTVLHAAEIAGIDRSTHYRWLEGDAEYAKAFVEAEDKAVEALEKEARRRALEGTEKPVYQNGRMVGVIREYSDTLLIFLLKGAKPQKYRERVDMTMDVRREIERLTSDPAEQEAALAEAERIIAKAKS